jgi:hypothetical protein
MKYKLTYPPDTAGESLLVQTQRTSHKDRAVQQPVKRECSQCPCKSNGASYVRHVSEINFIIIIIIIIIVIKVLFKFL